MWKPVGPLPAAVYWRRRCVALASAVTLVGLVVATAGAPGGTPVPAANRATVPAGGATSTAPVRGDGGSAPGSTAAGSAPTTGPGAAATGPTVSGAPSVTHDVPPPDGVLLGGSVPGTSTSNDAGPGGTASVGGAPDGTAPDSAVAGASLPGGGGGTGTASATPAPGSTAPGPVGSAAPDPISAASTPGTSTERIRPDDTPRASVAAQPSVPVPPTGPVPCTNAMLAAAAELEQPVHKVGSRPVLRLVLTNISGQPCVRDLDAARQEIVVWSSDGVDRLWSSNDCVNAPTIDLRTLVPGRPVAFAVTWAERTTVPGCNRPRTLVPAGTYRLMVRLDDLVSPPTPFIRTT